MLRLILHVASSAVQAVWRPTFRLHQMHKLLLRCKKDRIYNSCLIKACEVFHFSQLKWHHRFTVSYSLLPQYRTHGCLLFSKSVSGTDLNVVWLLLTVTRQTESSKYIKNSCIHMKSFQRFVGLSSEPMRQNLNLRKCI